MLGISVYFKDFDEEYIVAAFKVGVTDVFTSLHIPEEDLSGVKDKFLRLCALCNEYGVNLVPDISPIAYQKLGVSPGDNAVFKKLGIRTLRLDFGFDELEVIKTFQRDFRLVLNASTVNKDWLAKAQNRGVNFSEITFMHNFYPKINTGLAKDTLVSKNVMFAEMGLHTAAFVPGDQVKRFPFYDGLPTLEKHRGANPFVAAVELLKQTGTQGILVGDSKANIKTLKYINAYQQSRIVNLPSYLESEYRNLHERIFKLREDLPENLLRLITERHPVPVGKTINRPCGTITMDNDLAERYSGELEIARKDIGFSRSANFIGTVLPEYHPLLSLIDEKDQIAL